MVLCVLCFFIVNFVKGSVVCFNDFLMVFGFFSGLDLVSLIYLMNEDFIKLVFNERCCLRGKIFGGV